MNKDLQQRIHDAIANPKNIGEMENADSVGTVGSADCGDMLRMWVKFKDEGGRKVIDRATFQTFGCETAIAVASVATELIPGKTVEEALSMNGADLSAPLGSFAAAQNSLCTTCRGSAQVCASAGCACTRTEEWRADIAAAAASAGTRIKEK